MTEVVAAAEAAGLTLPTSQGRTGFLGVTEDLRVRKEGGPHPFYSRVWQGKVRKNLGSYATAHEAALAIAEYLGQTASSAKADSANKQGSPFERAKPDIEFLQCSYSKTGYKGVTKRKRAGKEVYAAHVPKAINKTEKPLYVGTFLTIEEAAIAIACKLGPEKARGACGNSPCAHLSSLSFMAAERMEDAHGLRHKHGRALTSSCTPEMIETEAAQPNANVDERHDSEIIEVDAHPM
eukprot:CAMPEP_0119321938 /NCGR_PEP_ID=MMETSP1333-20130426/56858_1 /TAXON_ID=418940 /ORGANISM="Scyphosphaera apsteinii, Strain RCC1455" /LENGTH=236 /DNA_ID=CAMNT_0007329043 /DNA_START=79 /DNA_END=789 /DNA_ORIENTATION=-